VPLIVEILVALGLASAVAGVVQAWRRGLANGRREDLRALAARRGWSLTVTGGRLGREGALRLAPAAAMLGRWRCAATRLAAP
jgi:hypothetical protein